jgi:hypothetical protein
MILAMGKKNFRGWGCGSFFGFFLGDFLGYFGYSKLAHK